MDMLCGSTSDAADYALLEALQYVAPDMQLEIVDALLERGRDVGLNALPGLLDQVEESARNRIILSTSRLFAALRTAARSGRTQTRSNTLRIVRDSGNLRLAYVASTAMSDASPRIRAEAALVLMRLAERFRQRLRETTGTLRDVSHSDEDVRRPVVHTLDLLQKERGFLTTALREALGSFESHHRVEVVAASMYMAEEMEDALFDKPSSRRGKLTQAMIEAFTESMSPGLAPFAYMGLRRKDLRGRIVAALAGGRKSAFVAEFIRYGWLARDPFIGRALRSIRTLAVLDDELEFVFALPRDVAELMPAWLLYLGVPADVKVSVLNHVFLLDNPGAHRAAAWAVATIRSAASARTLHVMLESEDEAVRGIARQELDHRRRHLAGQSELPMGRPEAWRTLLRAARVSEDFNEFWDHFERIDPTHARAGGFHAMSYIPGFSTQIRVHLLGRKPEDRHRALRLALLLHVAEHFRNEIFGLAQDQDIRIRSATMTALGHIGGAASRRILERALNDDEPAVQAAAIGGLDRMEADGRDELIRRKCNAEDAHVRAAAIRALLRMRMPEGATNLIYMLHDPRPQHRSAALLVIDRMNLAAVSSRVMEIANTDKDVRVARTAVHVLKRLDRKRRAAEKGLAAAPGGTTA